MHKEAWDKMMLLCTFTRKDDIEWLENEIETAEHVLGKKRFYNLRVPIKRYDTKDIDLQKDDSNVVNLSDNTQFTFLKSVFLRNRDFQHAVITSFKSISPHVFIRFYDDSRRTDDRRRDQWTIKISW